MPHLVGHGSQQVNADAHPTGASWRRRPGQIRRGGCRRVEDRAPIEHSDLDPSVSDRSLDLDLPGRPAVAVDHDVAGRLVDGLDEVVGRPRRAPEVGDRLSDEGPDLGQPIGVGRHEQPARLVVGRNRAWQPAQAMRAKSAVARLTNRP